MNRAVLIFFIISCLLPIMLLGFKLSLEISSELPVHNVNTGLNYATIQEAIDAPETLNGHIIFVKSGTYYEHIVIDKSLTLLGENKNTTIIDGNRTGTVIYIFWTNNVTIFGLTIQNSGSGSFETGQNDSGIGIFSADNCSITNNVIKNCLNGIMSPCSNALIASNILSDNKRGIYALDCCNSTIIENMISDNEYGMDLLDCRNSTICRNDLRKNEVGIEMSCSNNNIIYQNNFVGNNVQVKVIFASLGNEWNKSLEGNYWSDFEEEYPYATEIDASGIWNTPYVIDSNNIDHYPIVPEFPSFHILLLFMMIPSAVIIHWRKHKP